MVVKGAEEVEHAEAISKYRDKAEGQRPCMGVVVCISIDQTDCLENTEVLKQEVERGEEATTSPEGLSYQKSSIS